MNVTNKWVLVYDLRGRVHFTDKILLPGSNNVQSISLFKILNDVILDILLDL